MVSEYIAQMLLSLPVVLVAETAVEKPMISLPPAIQLIGVISWFITWPLELVAGPEVMYGPVPNLWSASWSDGELTATIT